jgi:hypothetical protein
MASLKDSDISSWIALKPSTTKAKSKRYIGEKILSLVFHGPSGTSSSKNERELREKYEEDKLDIPKTEKEEKERQVRIKRAEINWGGDGVRTNDMQKECSGGDAYLS